MRARKSAAVMVAVAGLWAAQAQAQEQPPAQGPTADEVVEKYLAAIGGRSALSKVESRVSTGTITVSVQGMQLGGAVELYNKAPNKSRMYSRIDLSQVAPDAGEVVVDQRCDGKSAWMSNSMQGDRDVTGSQLQGMLNATFPSPLLNYKEAGAKIELAGKDKVGDREAYVLQYTPKAGPATKQYIDAQTYQMLKAQAKVDAPELGGEVEQVSEFSDYREVDGVKLPFVIKIANPQQLITITLLKVEHNRPMEDWMFSKPAPK